MKWITIALLLCVLLLGVSSPALADEPEVDITVSAYIVGVPGGFTVTYVSDTEVLIEWTTNPDAVKTMVRSATGHPPESITDGNLVYYGDAESYTDTSVSLDETLVPVYYRAWSEKADGRWSPMFAEDEIEGVGMTIFAVVAIILAFMAMGFIFKNGILHLAATLGWVLFAFLMYGKAFENTAMNNAFLVFGGGMAMICGFLALSAIASKRAPRMSLEDSQREYKRQVLNITKRR